MQRTFITGDKWLYYKIYTGLSTADFLLSMIINPLSKRLTSRGLINKWFFIRYSDPHNHIRWRLEIKNKKKLDKVITSVFNALKPYVDAGFIYDIQTETYKRELERYGSNSIKLSEILFWHDSIMITELFKINKGDHSNQIRALSSMKAIDLFLSDFKYNTQQKYELTSSLFESFGKEFNMNSTLYLQLSNKYRKEKSLIFDIMHNKNDHQSPFDLVYNLLNKKSIYSSKVIKQIIELDKASELKVSLTNLIKSHIHMEMNRFFQSKQRLHELVIYGFLSRYYCSILAREKYNKCNA